MEDLQAFSRQLEELLDARRDKLDRIELPKLKESFKNFQSSFIGLNAVLHKKGVLHEDPYKYDLKISDVTTPSDAPFSESEKADQMSVRASQFEAYLEFLIIITSSAATSSRWEGSNASSPSSSTLISPIHRDKYGNQYEGPR